MAASKYDFLNKHASQSPGPKITFFKAKMTYNHVIHADIRFSHVHVEVNMRLKKIIFSDNNINIINVQ